jgi:hypothetical protein
MRIGERERLVTRVQQIRRTGADPASDPRVSDRPQLVALEERIAHLEKLLEGLQTPCTASRSDTAGGSPSSKLESSPPRLARP